MNIFVLSENPEWAAKYHHDKHVVKMILESAQLLCTAKWVMGEEAQYKRAFENHPCAIWARKTYQNYMWLCELGLALCAEYTFRFGKVHVCEDLISSLKENPPAKLVAVKDQTKLTPFHLAMPDVYKRNLTAVDSYRLYYVGDKIERAQWRGRGIPKWVKTFAEKLQTLCNNV